MRRWTWMAVLALAAGLLVEARPAAAQTNLLTNGSFEGVVDGEPSLAAGSTAIPGWTIVDAEAAWLPTGAYGTVPSDGDRCLDLSGYHDHAPYAGVLQSIATQVGATYRLSFDLGSIVSGNDTSLRASAGSTFQDFLFTRTGVGSEQQWGSFSLDFVATGSNTAIALKGLSTASGNNIGLDNARVILLSDATGSPAVPEPSAALLFLPALGVLALLKRRLGQ